MTTDKARKIAIRRRMAETGEPYSVARHATAGLEAEAPDPGFAGPSAGSASSAGLSWADLSPDERYARDAAAAGRTPDQVEADTAAFRAQEHADRAQERADQARERADQAREQVSDAESAIDAADERADLAWEAADRAQDGAGAAELSRAREHADAAEQDAERARQRAEAAEAAADAADEEADRAQEAADRAAEIAEELRDGPGPWNGPYFRGGPGRVSRPAPGWLEPDVRPVPEGGRIWGPPPRLPRPPAPPRPPRPPAPPRPFR